MLKAILSYSKKVPAETEYSSQGYSLSLETELPEGLSQDKIQERIHQTFELVKTAVEQELQNGKTPKEKPVVAVAHASADAGGSLPTRATNKQLKYLSDLARERNIPLSELNAQVKELYGADSIYGLSKHEASKLVDSLRRDRKAA